MHIQSVTCAISAPRPHDWDGLASALLAAEAEAKRQGFDCRRYRVLTPDNSDGGWWGWSIMRKARTCHTRNGRWKVRSEFTEVAILGEGMAEKE